MPQRSFRVPAQIPDPARSLLAVVQSALKLSKAECQRIIRDGGVKVDGKIRNKSHELLDRGQQVHVDWLPPPVPLKSQRRTKTSDIFSVVHEDRDLVVVLKPASLLTVPTKNREGKTLVSMVTHYLQKTEPEALAYCVHRLDRGVSGLLVFAKSLPIAERIRDQFADRKPDRTYSTIVSGVVAKDQATIKSYLATDENLSRYSTNRSEDGELAITHYSVRERWSDATLLEVKLETGRRNQIRVHLAEAGHPVIGDPRYKSQLAEHRLWPYGRLALHAESLGFTHPRTGEALAFQSSWPQEYRDFMRSISKHS